MEDLQAQVEQLKKDKEVISFSPSFQLGTRPITPMLIVIALYLFRLYGQDRRLRRERWNTWNKQRKTARESNSKIVAADGTTVAAPLPATARDVLSLLAALNF